ncbi:MAG: molybdopterin-dependent oxidoreductase [Pirellulaceae bacterium]|jgi:anaerobic selenocysteine-containing dehydrogenase|nr:molybdopterin-dependent oxidoreductase [Pirellulaceae bacterium]MDP7016492.1 molybdopterin-dependent oxidoreductase [Pirellulaceae bacterium]
MPKQIGPVDFDRRAFLQMAATSGVGVAATSCFPTEFVESLNAAPATNAPGVKLLQAACPYCGVGCGTLIKVENGKVVGMVPDKKHPTNKGIQCIKGLNAHEPIYRDRLTKVLIRKDYSRPLEGHVSSTKGRFDDDVFREASYEEAEEFVADRIAEIIEAKGGNSIALTGSGQLTMEAQWIENLLMKGIIQSNSIEANARMCMTSAVTGYFHSYGSDAPPTSYEDIEEADFITFWGHNAREAHPILFWRVADHKMKNGVPTLVSDPRRTGTVIGLEDINPRNSIHIATLNGDISYLNAIGHVLWNDHRDACMDEDWLNDNVEGWREYVAGLDRYAPEDVVERTQLLDRGRVTPEQIRETARLWAEASKKGRSRGRGGVLSFWGIGYNQMLHGQHNTISIINLHLLTGNVGRPGCGSHSQTGQPNAMSERLMGGLTGRLPFNQPLANEAWRNHIADAWRVPRQRLEQTSVAPNPGMVMGMMERALREGDDQLQAMFWMYTTHIHLPDVRTLVRPALTRMFCVVQDIYRHAPNLLYGDVIFPAATWGEWHGGTYIQSERRVYVCDGANNPPPNCRPDMDMAIDKCKALCHRLGLDADKVLPYKKKIKAGNGLMIYDEEEVFEDIIRASAGSDADLTGMLKVKERDGVGLYDQIRELRGVQWPAPTYDIARKGGTPRRYLGQEGWAGKPYGAFRRANGKAKMKLCEQDYTNIEAITDKLMQYGHRDRPGQGPWLIDELDAAAAEGRANLLVQARDAALVPDLPDLAVYDDEQQGLEDHKRDDVYPFWLGLGIVYEHFHTAKTIRGATTQKLVPEQYVEMNLRDAQRYGLRDGDMVRLVTRRGVFECRVTIGLQSELRPSRSEVPEGYLFSPWNLSVADSADPTKNRWLVNGVSHRAWDPVSGQVDFKKLAARIERI